MKGKGDDEEYDNFQVETKFPHPGNHYNTPSNNPYHHSTQSTPPTTFGKNYKPVGWEGYFDEMYYLEDGTSVFRAGNEGALYFCIHGAGHSALSFALLGKEVKKFGMLVAFDLKGHGMSKNQKSLDNFDIGALVDETASVLKQIVARYPEHNVIMVGHSLGGSICCRLTQQLLKEETMQHKIQGMLIVDVVQGTAMEALPFMISILNNRPAKFESLEAAIKWSIMSGTLKKLESAKVSIPPQLIESTEGGKKVYSWKVDLKQTEKEWKGWFTGLTQSFLNIRIPKTLVLAERERLDKELMIAQMQGKFRLAVLQHVGHSVQEDDYKGTARLLYDLVQMFRIPQNEAEEKQRAEVGLAKFHPDLKPFN